MQQPELRNLGDTSTLENPSLDLTAALTGLTDGTIDSASGASVTPLRAMKIVAFFRCVSILGGTIASTELLLYSRKGRTRTLLDDDPRFGLLHDCPNDNMTAFSMWQYVVVCMAIWGHGYVWMETDDNPKSPTYGQVIALWPIHPAKISKAIAPNGKPVWVVESKPGDQTVLFMDEVMHFQGVGLDTDSALAPYQMMRDELGISMAATDYAGRVFQNGSVPGGTYETDKTMTDNEFNTFLKRQRAAHEGLRNSHRMAVLPKGMRYTESQFDPSNTQMIEARVTQAKFVAMALGIPPRLLGITDGTGSYSSVESDMLSFIIHTLRPWFINIQQTIKKGMFSNDQDKALKAFVEFDTRVLLVPDSISRAKIDQSDIMFGVRNVDEIREDRGEDPLPDGAGAVYWKPVTLQPIDSKGMPLTPTHPESVVLPEAPTDTPNPLTDPLADPASSDVH